MLWISLVFYKLHKYRLLTYCSDSLVLFYIVSIRLLSLFHCFLSMSVIQSLCNKFQYLPCWHQEMTDINDVGGASFRIFLVRFYNYNYVVIQNSKHYLKQRNWSSLNFKHIYIYILSCLSSKIKIKFPDFHVFQAS